MTEHIPKVTGQIGIDRRQAIVALTSTALTTLYSKAAIAREINPYAGVQATSLRTIHNEGRPKEVHGGPLSLPEWSLGKDSTSPKTMLMFRGNPTHTFYGTGTLSENPKIVWSFKMRQFRTSLRGKPRTWRGTGWTGQPVIYGGFVFVGGVDRNLYALEEKTGAMRWRLEAGRMFKSSPCFYENRLYIGNTDNLLRCVDASTGHVLWATRMGADCDSSPCVVNHRLYICGESGHSRCLNPRTGDLIWETFLGGRGPGTLPGSNGVESSPAISHNELFATSYDGDLFCVDAQNGDIRWTAKTGDDTDVSPVITDDFVYTAAEERSSKLFCFDRHQRGRLLWSFEGNKRGYWSTPALADGLLFIGGNDGVLYAVEAQTGRARWSFKTGGPIWSSPAWVDGRVIFGSTDQHLYVLDSHRGRLLSKVRLDGRTISTPAVHDGRIYIGTSSGDFYCIG